MRRAGRADCHAALDPSVRFSRPSVARPWNESRGVASISLRDRNLEHGTNEGDLKGFGISSRAGSTNRDSTVLVRCQRDATRAGANPERVRAGRLESSSKRPTLAGKPAGRHQGSLHGNCRGGGGSGPIASDWESSPRGGESTADHGQGGDFGPSRDDRVRRPGELNEVVHRRHPTVMAWRPARGFGATAPAALPTRDNWSLTRDSARALAIALGGRVGVDPQCLVGRGVAHQALTPRTSRDRLSQQPEMISTSSASGFTIRPATNSADPHRRPANSSAHVCSSPGSDRRHRQ